MGGSLEVGFFALLRMAKYSSTLRGAVAKAEGTAAPLSPLCHSESQRRIRPKPFVSPPLALDNCQDTHRATTAPVNLQGRGDDDRAGRRQLVEIGETR